MHKILIFDLNLQVINQVKWALFQENFTIQSTTCPKEALHIIASEPLDLIFIDADGPNQEGFNLYKELKTLNLDKKALLIFMSEFKNLTFEQSNFILNSADYIQKPIHNQMVVIRTKQLLGLPLSHVLFIDSFSDNSNTIKQTLSLEGFHVSLIDFQNVTHNDLKCDLIVINTSEIIDTSLYEALTQLPIPLIFITDQYHLSSVLYHYSFSAKDFLLRPFQDDDLVLRIKRALSNNKISFQTKVKPQPKQNETPVVSEQKLDSDLNFVNKIQTSLDHEIRNPLTSILIGAQALNSRFSENSDERQVIEGIEKCSKRIEGIMDSLKNLKRVDFEQYADGIHMLNLSNQPTVKG